MNNQDKKQTVQSYQNGIYRFDIVDLATEPRQINFRIEIYYDESSTFIAKRDVQACFHVMDPECYEVTSDGIMETYRWQDAIFTFENDIRITLNVEHRFKRLTSTSARRDMLGEPPVITTKSFNFDIKVEPPRSFDRKMIYGLNDSDIIQIMDKYLDNYNINKVGQSQLLTNKSEIDYWIARLENIAMIEPFPLRTKRYLLLSWLIPHLEDVSSSIDDKISSMRDAYETRIRRMRNRLTNDGIRERNPYYDTSAPDMLDYSSASYIRWEQLGRPGIRGWKI